MTLLRHVAVASGSGEWQTGIGQARFYREAVSILNEARVRFGRSQIARPTAAVPARAASRDLSTFDCPVRAPVFLVNDHGASVSGRLAGINAGQLSTGFAARPSGRFRPADAVHHGPDRRPSTHADKFRNRMTELNVRQDLLVIDESPHAFLGRQKWFDQAVNAAADFFEATLKR